MECLMLEDFSRHQQKIIKRYYANEDKLALQKLADLVGELYLAEGKAIDRLWKKVPGLLEKLGLSKDRIDHLVAQKKPELLAAIVKEAS
jgi:hypothetical protein